MNNIISGAYYGDDRIQLLEEARDTLLDILDLDIAWGSLPIEFLNKPIDDLDPEILNEILGVN